MILSNLPLQGKQLPVFMRSELEGDYIMLPTPTDLRCDRSCCGDWSKQRSVLDSRFGPPV